MVIFLFFYGLWEFGNIVMFFPSQSVKSASYLILELQRFYWYRGVKQRDSRIKGRSNLIRIWWLDWFSLKTIWEKNKVEGGECRVTFGVKDFKELYATYGKTDIITALIYLISHLW